MSKTLRLIYTVAAGLLIGGAAQAQIQHGGSPTSFWHQNMINQRDVPVMKMEPFDIAAMQAEDEINEQYKIGPWRFGKNFPVNYDINTHGVWEEDGKGGRVWRIGLHSEGALSINIEFSSYVLPEGATVFMYGADRKDVRGSWTHENNKTSGILATDCIQGETVYVEYHEPAAVRGQGALTIGRVTHDYRGIYGYARRLAEQGGKKKNSRGLGDSGSCNNNVICPEGDPWRCQIKSVVIIIAGGSGACTATVMNNVLEDETPYVLSANHCGTNSTNWVWRFNWDSPTCTPTANGPTNQSVSGGTMRAANGGSDFALHEMSSAIPASYDTYYSGWDASGAMPARQVAIHHPSGDVKKISFDDNGAAQATFGGAQCWNVMNWEDGTTEPGSSGSGLWDQNQRLIGQLYGGSASCASITDDYYGRFDVSWGLGASQWLDPGNTGTLVMDGKGTGACAGITFNLDAMPESIDDVQDSYCNQTAIIPSVTIKNDGTDPLTSVNVNYNYNGGAATGQVPWTGNLAAGGTASVTLPAMTLISGQNTIDVNTSDPNGGTDEDMTNDAINKTFVAILNGENVTVNIIEDQYGSETTWEITDASNNVIASDGPWTDGNDQTLHTYQVCLEVGQCYDFTINDSYGDGICCGFGQGSYEVINAGNVVASGGQFAFTETTNFCVVVGVEENLLEGLSIYPNPTNGQLTVDMMRMNIDEATVTVYNLVGEVIAIEQTNASNRLVQFDLSDKATGMYLIEVATPNGRAIQKVMLER